MRIGRKDALERGEIDVRGILGVSDAPLVGADFSRDPRSAVVDAPCTRVTDGRLVKVMAWYDNEWGYANRMVDLARRMAGADVAMLCSVLLEKGPQHLATVLADLQQWMEEKEYSSVTQMKGSMSQRSVASMVVLPEPFRPKTAMISPVVNSKSTSLNTGLSP